MRVVFGASVMLAAAVVAGTPAQAADPSRCSPDNPSECLNGVSGVVTSLDALRVRTSRLERDESERDKRDREASMRPLTVSSAAEVSALGTLPSGWGLWASAARARFEGSVPVVPYDAELDTFSVGADRLLGGRFLLGAALLAERLDTRTRYNAGGQDADAVTLVGYGSYIVNETVSVELTIGKGEVDTNQTRLDPASAPGVPLRLRSSYDADRTLWSLTLNASRQLGALGVGGRLGYLRARERQDGYTESGGPSARTVLDRTVSLAQAFAGVDASYGLTRSVQLHGAAVYRRDTSRDDGRSGGGLPNAVGATTPDDRDEFEWVLGVRYYSEGGFSLNLEYLHTAGRNRFKNESLTLTGRFDF